MIAIVMGTYNGERYLKEQLDSLFENSCQDWVLYVCDDGSTDRTPEIVEAYRKRYPERIRFRRNPKNLRSAGNFFSGTRWAWEQTSADYYMFCDQDDRWDQDKIELSLNRIRKLEKKAGKETPLLVYTDSRLVDQTGQLLAPSFQKTSHFRSEHCDLAHLLMENKMPGCTEMMNEALVRRVFLREDFPEDMKMHDWWFGLTAAAFGKIAYVNRAAMDYRQHEGNVVGGTGFISYLKKRLMGLHRQRESIRENIRQGESFYRWYGADMKEQERQILQAFCELNRAGALRRRYLLFRYHFWKSGLIRNVALFLLI